MDLLLLQAETNNISGGGAYMGYYLIAGVFMLISLAVGSVLKNKFNKYSQVPIASGMSGREVAAKMLADNGITDVTIESVQGKLTDHYNPTNKTVNLSPEVYQGRSVAAAAVAAHEVGHAVQHATSYSMLQMRSKLVPMVSVASRWMQWVVLAGVLLISTTPWILGVGIILYGATTLFSFVTLPVEFDASKRALRWLNTTSVTGDREHEQARDALKWAALTYVVAALASLGTLAYFIMLFLRARR